MRTYIDWRQQGSALIEIDDHDLHRAADAGVNLDDEDALSSWLQGELLSDHSRWLADAVDDHWVEKDRPELINPILVEGDPPQWWIDLHPDGD